MIYIVLGLIGAVMGSFYLHGRGDFLLGGLVGLLGAAVINQRNGLLVVKKRLAIMETQIAGLLAAEKVAGPAASADVSTPARTAHAGSGREDDDSQPQDGSTAVAAVETPAMSMPSLKATAEIPSLELELSDDAFADLVTPPAPPTPDRPSPPSPGLGDQMRAFFFGGNMMVRVGVVVLLVVVCYRMELQMGSAVGSFANVRCCAAAAVAREM